MPCRDYMDDNPGAYYGEQLRDKAAEIERLQKKLSFAESALCAVLRSTENAGFDVFYKTGTIYVDWVDAGLNPKEVSAWFVKHKEVDKQVREKAKKAQMEKLAKEANARALKQAKEAALKKLTLAERKLLGV
jgi:hypothetical protein